MRRLLKDQDGFTLVEMMVTMTFMIVVFLALHSIFDTSIRTFRVGNDKVEAVENARLGLEKMEREIRAAYPVQGAASTGAQRYRFFSANGTSTNVSPSPAPMAAMPTPTQITFGNELGASGDDAIRCGSPCEYVTYKLLGSPPAAGAPLPACTASTGPCTLRRVNSANSADYGDPVVEFVRPGGLMFEYLTASGDASATQQGIARVGITVRIAKGDGTQNLTTEVTLRNPGTAS